MVQIPNARVYRGSDGNLYESPYGGESARARLEPAGYIQVAVPDDSVTSPAIPDDIVLALAKVEGGPIRYRDDGVDPTPSVGWPLDIGETLFYDATMDDIRLIGEADGALVNILMYREASGA